jgi:D-lactate dehydrogenase (cytochrome)
MRRQEEERMGKVFDGAWAELAGIFGARFSMSASDCASHAASTSWIAPEFPDAVVWPESEEEVVRIVGVCLRHRMPIVGFGSGTSFEGSVNAPRGGVSVDFRRMNRLVEVHQEDLDCVAEPGIVHQDLNERLAEHGLFFSVDPASRATLGGMASTRSSGASAARYGTMRDNVISLNVVLPTGELITTSRRARKSSAGYDLTRLFLGAEGTLGLITSLTLKVRPLPESIVSASCTFETLEACCAAVDRIARAGIDPARQELLDDVQILASNRYSNLSLPVRPTLFFEFHGTAAGTEDQARRVRAVVAEGGCEDYRWSADADEREAIWNARFNAFWASQALDSGKKIIVTDVAVPVSRLGECIAATKADLDASRLVGPILSHLGDGNFHALVLVDLEDEDEVERGRAFVNGLVQRALAMGGTCTGEHGIGQGKRKFMAAEHGEAGWAVMRRIKDALDPHGIMNPGKVV